MELQTFGDDDDDDSVVTYLNAVTVDGVAHMRSPNMLTVTGTIYGQPAFILLDSGSSTEFVSAEFIHRHALTTFPTIPERHVRMADGSKQKSSGRLEYAPLHMNGHNYASDFTVLPLSQYDAVIGMSWMQQYKPKIDWDKLTFEPTVLPNVNTAIEFPYTVHAIHDDTDDLDCAEIIREFDDVFQDLPATLPPKRTVDHFIELQPNSKPPYRASYRMSTTELAVLKNELDDLLQRGFIRPSTSEYGAPVLFVKKKSGELRMCIDYRQLNNQTIKNSTQMPREDEMTARLVGATRFGKIDLQRAYQHVLIHPPDIKKTAFNTRYGHFEYMVMPFGLCNAPATFQTLMQSVLADFLDDFVVVYLDDILIYSRNDVEHRQHIRKVLQRLREHKLYANRKKCEFGRRSVHFLGHVISNDGIAMDKAKVDAINQWPTPKSVDDVRSFVGLAGYYRKYVHRFGQIAAPLFDLLKKDERFAWTAAAQKAFDELKSALMSGPVLIIPDDTLPYTVRVDASGYAVGATLSQDHGRGQQPVAFMSHKMNAAQLNYPVHEQELLAMMYALAEWRHHLHGRRFIAVTDHHSLTFLKTQPNLSKRQIRWTHELADYDFDIVYAPGKQNTAADALSRRPDHRSPDSTDSQTSVANAIVLETKVGADLLEEIRRQYANDAECTAALSNPDSPYVVRDGLLYRPDGRLRLPNDDSIKGTLLFEAHDNILCGHVGVNKTAHLLGRLFDWPGLRQDVRKYITTCVGCQANKPSNQRPIGLLQSLPIPARRWETVTMDLITQLPVSRQQNDAIIVFVDKLSKMVHYVPCKTAVTAPEVAHYFFQHVIRLHGVPNNIVSDRDPRFTSLFWTALWTELGCKLKISTSYHPQTDGQTERSNRTLEDGLRAYVNYAQDDWDEKLLALEFAVNNSTQESTGFTPFYLNSGQHPHFPLNMLADKTDNALAPSMLRTLRDNLVVAKANIAAAQTRQARNANKSRRAHEFKVGEQVMLSTENMNVGERARKLCAKYAGPHRIIEHPTANTYRLESATRIEPITSGIQCVRTQAVQGRRRTIFDRPRVNHPPAIIEGDKEKYELEEIRDYRVSRGVGQYPRQMARLRRQRIVMETDRRSRMRRIWSSVIYGTTLKCAHRFGRRRLFESNMPVRLYWSAHPKPTQRNRRTKPSNRQRHPHNRNHRRPSQDTRHDDGRPTFCTTRHNKQ